MSHNPSPAASIFSSTISSQTSTISDDNGQIACSSLVEGSILARSVLTPGRIAKQSDARTKQRNKILRTSPDRFIPKPVSRAAYHVHTGDIEASCGLLSGNSPTTLDTTHNGRVASALNFRKRNSVLSYGKSESSKHTAEDADKSPPTSPAKRPKETPTRLDAAKILDAPGLSDDFYTTNIAWSTNGQLAVALKNEVRRQLSKLLLIIRYISGRRDRARSVYQRVLAHMFPRCLTHILGKSSL